MLCSFTYFALRNGCFLHINNGVFNDATLSQLFSSFTNFYRSISCCNHCFMDRCCELVNCTTLMYSSNYLSHFRGCFSNITRNIPYCFYSPLRGGSLVVVIVLGLVDVPPCIGEDDIVLLYIYVRII